MKLLKFDNLFCAKKKVSRHNACDNGNNFVLVFSAHYCSAVFPSCDIDFRTVALGLQIHRDMRCVCGFQVIKTTNVMKFGFTFSLPSVGM